MVTRTEKVVRTVTLAVFIVAVAFPFYWMLVSSTKSFQEIASPTPVFWPERFSIDAYRDVLVKHRFVRYFGNSVLHT
ncbi:MAG: carbohydrate ABC transporter permease, partial [Lentisphaerae bacterium]|nr:carbohydrate ABC transporter permease [Lentisphaerota bacterium]